MIWFELDQKIPASNKMAWLGHIVLLLFANGKITPGATVDLKNTFGARVTDNRSS